MLCFGVVCVVDDKLFILLDREQFVTTGRDFVLPSRTMVKLMVSGGVGMRDKFSSDGNKQSSEMLPSNASVERQFSVFLLLLLCGEFHTTVITTGGDEVVSIEWLPLPAPAPANVNFFAWHSGGLVISGELTSASGIGINVCGCNSHSNWYDGSMIPSKFSTSRGFDTINFSMAGKSILFSVWVAAVTPIGFDAATAATAAAAVITFSTLSPNWWMWSLRAIIFRPHISAGCDELRAIAYASTLGAIEHISFGKFGIERAGGKRPPRSICDANVE